MKKLITCSLLGYALFAMAQTSEQFSIATLNVDGLPKKILVFNVNANGPGDAGSSRIGKYLINKNYDLVFMQEDFNYHEVMKVWLEDNYKLCDGLMACWKNDLTVTAVPRTAWKQNFGKFSHAMDELVTKGFRRYEVMLRGGQRVVVYNLHMDASDNADVDDGNDMKDKEARMAQWMQLKDDILSQLDTRPVIIVGDVNTLYKRDDVKKEGKYPEYDKDAKVRNNSIEELAGETVDKILYINPATGTQLKPISFNVDKDGYTYEGKPLGDHYPISATFEITSRGSGIEATHIDEIDSSSIRTIYDLSGSKVSHPHGGVYIEQSGKKTKKRIVK